MSKSTIADEFKSHYVVWKLVLGGGVEIGRTSFKSHYVVWKLFSETNAIIPATAFKSHYVVWKQINIK